jgi:hypothetical protein
LDFGINPIRIEGYFTDVEQNLRIYDLADPFQPVLKTTSHTDRLQYKPLFYEDIGYTGGFMGMEVYDYANPYNPLQIGFISIPGYFSSPSIIGNRLVVLKVIMENKLTMFDLRIPAHPSYTGTVAPFGKN